MKRTIAFLIPLGIFGLIPAFADVIYVSGNVSGTWSADTVFVQGEVRVPQGQTLTIQPGVEVLFWGYYKFIVDSNATLIAMGTETDSIRFDVLTPGTSWHGIRFLSASHSSLLEYCHLTNGYAYGSGEDENGGAIYCYNSNLTIQNCLIDSCRAEVYGGGIFYYQSNPIINNNIVSGNETLLGYGGGICCYHSSPTITDNIIRANTAHWYGGGVFLQECSLDLSNNTIMNNFANRGGGVTCINCVGILIQNNRISTNSTNWSRGGGIQCESSYGMIENNVIKGNEAGGTGSSKGGGIYCGDYSSISIIHNQISENQACNGGGIHCSQNYDMPFLIKDNDLVNNIASGQNSGTGGGIYCIQSNPVIDGNYIAGNSAYGTNFGLAGGLYLQVSDARVENNFILDNSTSGSYYGRAGGIGITDHSSPIISNNIICGNYATERGGGISIYSYCYPIISNNTICSNTAGIEEGAIRISWFSSPTILNCIIWDNLPDQFSAAGFQVSYCDIQGGYPGIGNINEDPYFVNPDSGDYHLQSVTGSFHNGHWLPYPLHSPCIDAGDPMSSYANEPEPNGGRVNMGGYANTTEASLSWISSILTNKRNQGFKFIIYPPHPNPFNPTTTLTFTLPVAGMVKIEVFDINGRTVGARHAVPLHNAGQWYPPGTHSVLFDGSGLSSGIYLARLSAGDFTQTQKLVLLK